MKQGENLDVHNKFEIRHFNMLRENTDVVAAKFRIKEM